MKRTASANQRRSEGMRRAWEERRQETPPYVTDDGVAPHATVRDEVTGCDLWQGWMSGREPVAGHRGVKVKVRLLTYQRARGPLPSAYRLGHCPHSDRCLTPDHQVPEFVEPRSGRLSITQRTLVGRLPAERPPHISEREWAALTAVVAGKTLAEVATELGVSRQRVHQLVERARAKLTDRPT